MLYFFFSAYFSALRSLPRKWLSASNTSSVYKVKNEIETFLSSLPNLALDNVPIGKDESMNKEWCQKKIGKYKTPKEINIKKDVT